MRGIAVLTIMVSSNMRKLATETAATITASFKPVTYSALGSGFSLSALGATLTAVVSDPALEADMVGCSLDVSSWSLAVALVAVSGSNVWPGIGREVIVGARVDKRTCLPVEPLEKYETSAKMDSVQGFLDYPTAE